MIHSNLHTHTNCGDGKNSPEEVILQAISEGLSCIGFSEHSPISVPHGVGMSEEGMARYRMEIPALREKYAGKIRVLMGMEQDSWSERPEEPFDYLIGSTHLVWVYGEFIAVDHAAEMSDDNVKRLFGGDWYAYAEAYFEAESQVIERTGADIIGHFDLVSVFNHNRRFFDPSDPRYVRAWKRAVDALIPYGRPFEINTGAMARGYRKTQYPSLEIIEYIRSRGGHLILSSDSHRVETLTYGFRDLEYLLTEEEKTPEKLLRLEK